MAAKTKRKRTAYTGCPPIALCRFLSGEPQVTLVARRLPRALLRQL
jgi:hypothetical protein